MRSNVKFEFASLAFCQICLGKSRIATTNVINVKLFNASWIVKSYVQHRLPFGLTSHVGKMNKSHCMHPVISRFKPNVIKHVC